MKNGIFLFLMYCVTLPTNAQKEKLKTLDEKFNLLKKESQNYTIFKVIVKDDLNVFWKEVTDSLELYKTELIKYSVLVEEKLKIAETARQEKIEIEGKMNALQVQIQKRTILGLKISHTTLNIVSWFVFLSLILIIGLLVVKIRNTAQNSKVDVDEKNRLERELSEQKEKLREIKTKLKRELQTALNEIEDHKKSR